MKYLFTLFLSLFLLSCNESKKETANVKNNLYEVDSISITKTPVRKQSLTDSNQIELVLENSTNQIKPSGKSCLVFNLDSLHLSKNPNMRKYYFSLFLKVIDENKGASTELIGSPALKYVEKYTAEFLGLSSYITKEQFDFWASYIGNEISRSSKNDPIKDGDALINKLNANCLEFTDQEKRRLNDFNTIIIKTIKENNK